MLSSPNPIKETSLWSRQGPSQKTKAHQNVVSPRSSRYIYKTVQRNSKAQKALKKSKADRLRVTESGSFL